MNLAASKGWKDTNNRHHSVVFVFCDVAMIDEVSDIESSEIDSNRDAGEWMLRITVPIGNLNRIHELILDTRI
jgi:hypothetical protein